jgi:hypothetical protein
VRTEVREDVSASRHHPRFLGVPLESAIEEIQGAWRKDQVLLYDDNPLVTGEDLVDSLNHSDAKPEVARASMNVERGESSRLSAERFDGVNLLLVLTILGAVDKTVYLTLDCPPCVHQGVKRPTSMIGSAVRHKADGDGRDHHHRRSRS